LLDDVHLLRSTESRAALSVLANHVPAGSRLLFAGRTEPSLGAARLRAELWCRSSDWQPTARAGSPPSSAG